MLEDGTGQVRRNDRVACLLTTLALLALFGFTMLAAAPAGAVVNIEEIQDQAPDRDFRTGSVQPSSAQRSAASDLGARVRWNMFGTPQSLINEDGFLATGVQGSDAQSAARNFLAENAGVLGLSSGYVRDTNKLQFTTDTPMGGSEGHAVFFSQQFGGVPAVKDGLLTVGLTGTGSSGWDVAYVSSSLTKDTRLTASASDPALSGSEAWIEAARSAGEDFVPADIEDTSADRLKDADRLRSDFTGLHVDGLSQEQRVRLTAIPTPEDGVRPAYEAILVDNKDSELKSFTSFVDANTGKVLYRANNVQQLAQEDAGPEFAQAAAPAVPPPPTAQPFEGTFNKHSYDRATQNGPFDVPKDTSQISVTADATNPGNDISLQLLFAGKVVAESNTFTTPESILYEPAGGVPAGDYFVRVCNFQGSPVLPANTYSGFLLTSKATRPPDGAPYPPEWDTLFANPPIGRTIVSYPSTDTRKVICWNTRVYGDAAPAGCALDIANQASRSPWDVNTKANNVPTFTTLGNNASSAESWYGPTVPGPTDFRPFSATREYDYPWGNAWYKSTNPADPGKGCSPTELAVPGKGNDISAAVAALFATHNRIHDWSYNLGFTEQAFNLQVDNFGTTPPWRANDPELGDAQAGAVNGGAPTYIGRDNANQITLNDGIAPITNMYLWQPIAATFYAPCVDGDFDVSVITHEYGHAIQNRMVAGPDEGLSGLQADSMGESWSDLTAIEYLYEYGYEPGGGVNRYAVGPYITGNKQTGVRNYGMNDSPLNYSDIEYDPNGVTSPHADGEIWSAANFDIRKLLMDKYAGQFPSGPGTVLQRRCADGKLPAGRCPGNRRWVQIFHDAFLLMPSSVSFLDARDAYLAADRMRFGGANQRELWLAFSRHGMGEGATSADSNDRDPVPSFASPHERNAKITFQPTAAGSDVRNFEVYVGRYEARAVPVADGISSTSRTRTATFTPGTYEFVVRAPGFGLHRYERTFTTGQVATVDLPVQANLASLARGAKTTASSDASSGTGGSSASQLIDETEGSNWRADGRVEGKQVTVNLLGGSHTVDRVTVSAFLRPQEKSNKFGDTDTQGRFSALRQFKILTCKASAANANCTNPDRGFTTVFTSPETSDTGPASADVPRPVAPNLQFQRYDVRNTTATHVQLRVISNQCTGGPAYQGDPDADPTNNSDCPSGSDEDRVVRAAELEVFGR
jgi:hypothetical protein